MARDSDVSRRKIMKITGAAAATALVAGCGGDDGGNGNGNGGNGDNGNGDNGNGDNGNGGDPTVESGGTIEFGGQTSYWEGLAPSSIEGQENPTITLQEGEDYTIGWTEGDGSPHNLEIRDENDEVLESTGDPVADPGDGQFVEITASSEMAIYRCQPHAPMEGDIEIVGGNGGGNGNSSEDGNGNSSE